MSRFIGYYPIMWLLRALHLWPLRTQVQRVLHIPAVPTPPARQERKQSPVNWMWEDPEPNVRGVLLNDYIDYYAKTVGLIEFPADDTATLEQNMNPASYTLRVGNSFFQDDVERTLKKGDRIKIPPRGLVYVRVMEKVNIPYYMIARVNLRVTLVYQGLLMGTGPQVDPGYSGYIAAPVHNLTSSNRYLTYGDKFVTIDFEKTSPLIVAPGLASVQALLDSHPVGFKGTPFKLWEENEKSPMSQHAILSRLPRGQAVNSGLFDLAQQVRTFERRQLLNLGLVAAVIAVLAGAATWVIEEQRYAGSGGSPAPEMKVTEPQQTVTAVSAQLGNSAASQTPTSSNAESPTASGTPHAP